MVDFGGWDMPIHYGSQIEEHHVVRRDAGMFDVSHMVVLDMKGDGVRAFLRYALANDVEKLQTSGRALYSCLLRDDGYVLDDLIVYFIDESFFRIVVNAGTADKDAAWFESLRAKHAPAVTIQRRNDLGILAVQGPNARERVWQVLPDAKPATAELKPFTAVAVTTEFSLPPRGGGCPEGAGEGESPLLNPSPPTPLPQGGTNPCPSSTALLQTPAAFGGAPFEKGAWGAELFIARTGYTGEDGFEIIAPHDAIVALWQKLTAVGVRPCGLGARDTLRLEAGMNLYGQDMDETVSPLESGLAWTVDFKDAARDFVGKAALLAQPPARQLIGLLLLDSGGVLRAHQIVHTDHGDGEITSGTFSPTLSEQLLYSRSVKAPGNSFVDASCAIALARVPNTVQDGDIVAVAVRDKRLKARVVKPPFVKQGKILVGA
ncbi:MAG: glycine cleavage system protein T [Proteobacteria bacterium]|nr:glycine cleavage system protein T [Pseudomonadota bacterium]MCL2307283.1 glycine cleavage system protein T [Pseudomonadota bacterium]